MAQVIARRHDATHNNMITNVVVAEIGDALCHAINMMRSFAEQGIDAEVAVHDHGRFVWRSWKSRFINPSPMILKFMGQ